MPEICVVGSANLDIVVPVPHHPAAGETVLGGDHSRIPGGKGANQAVAAARLGRQVAFVGRVGTDAAGTELRSSLVGAGVDVSALATAADTPSGIALISVADDGDNAIVVSPGANGRLTPADIDQHASLLAEAAVTLVQLEVPLDAIGRAVELAGGLVIVNPAPAQPLDAVLLARADLVVPNQTELAILASAPVPTTADEAVDQARMLPVERVVVTLGAGGALIVDGAQVETVPAPEVSPVDTTAAGDAFCGALADALSGGSSLGDAVRWAVRVGAATTLVFGAQSSLPTRAEVDTRLLAS